MTKVLSLLGLTVVLAIIRAVVIALALAQLVALACAFITRPRGTLLLLGVLTLSGLAAAQPLAFIIALAIIAVVTLRAGRGRVEPSLTRLSSPR